MIHAATSVREFWFGFFSVKSRCKAATNLWADTDEEDNADSIDEDAQVETNEDQVNIFNLNKSFHILSSTKIFFLLSNT